MTDLKPCPFCGGTKIAYTANLYGVKIWCICCGATVMIETGTRYQPLAGAKRSLKARVIEKWNRRADDG